VPLACGSGTKGIRTPDLSHAIHGIPPRTPLLKSVGAAESQSTTAGWAPPLSLAVPYSMPQTCPKSVSGL